MNIHNIQNFITRDESAMYYECGYSADNAIMLRFGNELKFITDSRYSTEAKELSKKNISLEIIESHNLLEDALKQIKENNIKKIHFDPTRMCVSEYLLLKDSVALESSPNFTQIIRMQKTQEEIQILKESQQLNHKAFETFSEYIRLHGSGKSEKFLWYKVSDILSDCGRYPLSFNPIVGIQGNAAKPHALPSEDTLLNNGDTLLLDCGLKYKNYCSDCTRTALFYNNHFYFTKDQDFMRLPKDMLTNKHNELLPSQKQKIYDLVKKAQMTTIEKVRTGMSAKEVDFIARSIIDEGGYGNYFVHSTGHGIGLDIHELPFISKRSETIIEDNMVFSIEPGIYLDQSFGVRIEDLVVMKNGRAEIL